MKETSIKDITPYPQNAKAHPKKQIQQIAHSIREFGFNQPIVTDSKGVIIVGHGRFEAAKLMGLLTVPVLQLDLNEEQSKAYRLADNKLNESDWDMSIVITELKGLTPELLELTGFDKDLVLDTSEKDDDIPAVVTTEAIAKLGDIYQLGEHRVICGDSTSKDTVDKLLTGKEATKLN